MTNGDIAKISSTFALHPKISELLLSRGFTATEQIEAFLHSDFSRLSPLTDIPNILDVAQLIAARARTRDKIMIYGDYDCDGICAVSILYSVLSELGANVTYTIPDREDEGYGLSQDVAATIIEGGDVDMLITVDCGISSADSVRMLSEHGIDVIVTDHHIPPEVLPDCPLLNAKFSDNPAVRDICGTGLVLRLAEALCGTQALSRYSDIAAVATVADMVPLLADNRIIVTEGLVRINSRDCSQGIRLLLENGGFTAKRITSSDLAFYIAPRINAAGRVASAKSVPTLFLSKEFFVVDRLAKSLVQYNSLRQEKCDKIYAECLELLRDYDLANKRVIVLTAPDFEVGVIGIAAARLTKEFCRPTILFAKDGDVLKGSARSIPDIDLHALIGRFSSYLDSFGGHRGACGLSIQQSQLHDFSVAINNYTTEHYNAELFVSHDKYDLELAADDSFSLLYSLQQLEPFGYGNPSPTVYLSRNPQFSRVTVTRHIKATLPTGYEVIAFGSSSRLALCGRAFWRVYGQLEQKEYRGREYGQLRVTGSRFFDFQDSLQPLLDASYLKLLLGSHASEQSTSACAAVARGELGIRYSQSDLSSAIRMIGRSHFGTLFVAYSMDTYRAFCAALNGRAEAGYIHDYCVFTTDTDNPQNTFVFAPDRISPLYKRVVFLDTPPISGILTLTKNSDATVYVCDSGYEPPNVTISTQELRLIWRDIQDFLNSGKSFSELLTMQDMLYRREKYPPTVFTLAFCVLFESGALKVFKDFRLQTAPFAVREQSAFDEYLERRL